jgi:integrase
MGPRLKLPPYVHAFTDRHGKARFYFRRRGYQRSALPGLPYSPEFMEAYQQALAGAPAIIGASRTIAGTVSAAIVGYLASAHFHNLAPASQRHYRRIFERLRRDHGDKRIAKLERRHVVQMLDTRAATPIAARDFLHCLRNLIRYAISTGICVTDPTNGIKASMPRSGGFRTWSEDDIAAFEAYFAIGSKPRLALALLLHTGQRRADVVRMGRQHIRAGVLRVTQQKTGAELSIPVVSALAAVLAATPNQHMTFLVTDRGEPFDPEAFTKWFRRCCDAAGLKGCTAHGLRKAACRRLAEAGCSANEIAAISGHVSLREVERYTKAADQARMARNALARTKAATSSGKPD